MPEFNWQSLKNNTLIQILMWQILGQLVSGGVEPFLRELEHLENSKLPNEELSPADLATAVNRGFRSKGEGEKEALKSGIDSGKFDLLTKLAGMPPGVAELAEALRRGLIPYDAGSADGVGFIQGIRQSNVADKWAKMLQQLSVQWPSPTDALDAYLEGQVSEDTAKDLFHKFGGAPDYFQLLYNTRGSSPTPTQAAEMANRGIIPWEGKGAGTCSFEQAFLEGPWRNKWEPYFRKAAEYYPPPRTITAMVREGSLTDDQATKLLEEQGLSSELAAAYLKGAHKTNTEDSKKLARTTVSQLYLDRLISRSDAVGLLKELGYSEEDSEYILAADDMQQTERVLSRVLSKIQTLYTSYRISRPAASDALKQLGIPADQMTTILEMYDLEREANEAHITASQVEQAYRMEIIDKDDAMKELQEMGYTEYDAWLILSIAKKKAQGPPPAKA